MKQAELADILELSQSSYSRIENKAEKLTIEQLEKIAAILEVSPIELMTGEPQETDEVAKLKKRLQELEKWLEDKEMAILYLKQELKNANLPPVQLQN